jgi:hypothetical protein
MLRPCYLRFVLLLALFALPAHPQLGVPLGRCGPADPDWPQNQIPRKPASSPAPKKPALDVLQLQRDAEELAKLSASIQTDVNRANRGLLSKDLIDKLKRVEKLSKQLRGELTR